jgi:hypothetical protein
MNDLDPNDDIPALLIMLCLVVMFYFLLTS